MTALWKFQSLFVNMDSLADAGACMHGCTTEYDFVPKGALHWALATKAVVLDAFADCIARA